MRTNGNIYDGIPVLENTWLTEDGAEGCYTVGPVGKYRYLAVYNWSAACNISEIEIWSNVNTVIGGRRQRSIGRNGKMMRKHGITGTVLSPNLLVSAHPTEHCICIYAPEETRFRVIGMDGRVVESGCVRGWYPLL